MKMYANHKFGIVEDDEITSNNDTDIVCLILSLIAILLIVCGVLFVTSLAKAEAKEYVKQANEELCDLVDFNGFRCEKV